MILQIKKILFVMTNTYNIYQNETGAYVSRCCQRILYVYKKHNFFRSFQCHERY